jgi:hypothetical protein
MIADPTLDVPNVSLGHRVTLGCGRLWRTGTSRADWLSG